MKKIILSFLILICLVGCTSFKFDRTKFDTIMNNNFSHMLEISDDELKNSYKLDLTKFNEHVFKVSYEEPVNVYIALKYSNKKEAKKEIEKFIQALETKYDKDNQERINEGKITTIDNYLIYIVSDKNDEIIKEINEKMTK